MISYKIKKFLLSLAFILGSGYAFSSNAVVILTPTVFGSIEDSPPNGIGDTVVTFVPGVIDKVSSPPAPAARVTSAIVEYDVGRFSGTTLPSVSLDGAIFANNFLDTGIRNIDILLFEGDGVLSTTDFQIAATSIGMVAYAPPIDANVSFIFNVTDLVNSLIRGGATFIGVRFEALNEQAPSQLSSFNPPTLTIPEPATVALLSLGLSGIRYQRRRSKKAA